MKAFQVFPLLLICILVKANGWDEITAGIQNDRVWSGNYAISLCDSGQPDAHASKLLTLLPYIWQTIQAVLADAELGTASTHGFRSIFKTNTNKPFVQSVFQAVAQGRDIVRNTGKPSDIFSNPTIICANRQSTNIISTLFYRHFCIDDAFFAATHTTAASYAPGTNFIVLCPSFWGEPLNLTNDACPNVVGSRSRQRLVPNDDRLMSSLFATLLHELVHLYNPFEPGDEDDWEEKYRIQDVVDLDAEEALKNAQNFAAYAASVQAGCTRWPRAPTVKGELKG